MLDQGLIGFLRGDAQNTSDLLEECRDTVLHLPHGIRTGPVTSEVVAGSRDQLHKRAQGTNAGMVTTTHGWPARITGSSGAEGKICAMKGGRQDKNAVQTSCFTCPATLSTPRCPCASPPARRWWGPTWHGRRPARVSVLRNRPQQNVYRGSTDERRRTTTGNADPHAHLERGGRPHDCRGHVG